MLIFIDIQTYDWSQLQVCFLNQLYSCTIQWQIPVICLPYFVFSLCYGLFLCSRNLQCDRNTIHKNLVLSLMLAEIVFIIGISLVQDRVSFLASSYTEWENTIQPNIIDKMRKRSSDWFIQSYRYSRNKILAYKDETLKKKLINLEKKNK